MCPDPHGLDGALDGAVGGHDDDLGERRLVTGVGQHGHPVGGAHLQIRQHQIEGLRHDALTSEVSVLGLVDVVPRAPEHHRERRAHVPLVVDYEDLRHAVEYHAEAQRSMVLSRCRAERAAP